MNAAAVYYLLNIYIFQTGVTESGVPINNLAVFEGRLNSPTRPGPKTSFLSRNNRQSAEGGLVLQTPGLSFLFGKFRRKKVDRLPNTAKASALCKGASQCFEREGLDYVVGVKQKNAFGAAFLSELRATPAPAVGCANTSAPSSVLANHRFRQ